MYAHYGQHVRKEAFLQNLNFNNNKKQSLGLLWQDCEPKSKISKHLFTLTMVSMLNRRI